MQKFEISGDLNRVAKIKDSGQLTSKGIGTYQWLAP